MCRYFIIQILAIISVVLNACSLSENYEENSQDTNINLDSTGIFAHEGITELKRGDIIVKANSLSLPRSAYIEKGWGFGHAAIVTKGASGLEPDSILANSYIYESHAKAVPKNYQLREVKGLDLENKNPYLINDGFSSRYKGSRYRLRLNLPEEQIEDIIEFIESQAGNYSRWNSMKRYPGNPEIDLMVEKGLRRNWADNDHWYCSLLIWQAVLYVSGIDLDSNGGYFVYPNDLIASPYFNNENGFKGRTRF